MNEMSDDSSDDVLPSGSSILNSQQQSTSSIIPSEEEIINKLNSLSKEIGSVEASIIPSSGLKLKDPPDLNEILKTDEALIPPTSHNVGVLNSACQLLLKEMEYQLLKLLKINRNEQETVLGFLNSKGKMQDLDSGKKNVSFKCSGMPYFKDLDGFFPPDNEDVVAKKKNNELLPMDFIDVAPTWNLTDTKTLVKAVKSFPDCNSIDWLKVSATHMNGRFSAVECMSKWLLHLKPGVNRSKWSTKESNTLEKIAKKYNYQDWDSISKELGTNRTGLQCCARFHSQNVANSGKRWSKEEDEELKKLIDKFKIKDHIPWAKVAWHFESRSLRQCQERFDYHLGNIKKGVFTVEEDFVLVYLATKLKNFGEVAKYLPNRASTQVRARYEYLVKISMPKFTKEEDELLTKLMIQYPRNWTKISKHFENRSKLQCRRRWSELQKNINLDNANESDQEEEGGLLHPCDNSNPTNSGQKIDEDLYLKNLHNVSKAKVNKTYSGEYKNLLQYHNHCHKFLFGPKPRLPTSGEESKKCLKTLKTIMNNLSINPSVPLDTFDTKVLPNNCEFDSEDMLLLKEINDTKELQKEIKISDKIIPPNYITLVGLRSLLLTRDKIKNLSKVYEPPETNSNNINPENRLLFTDAKKLFKARMKALFAYPLLLSDLSQKGVEVKPKHKPKVRKAVKKMSKLRRKEHAKLMNQAYRRQKKLNEQLLKSGEIEKSDDECKPEESKTVNHSKKRKSGRKVEEKKKEEPEAKKPRRSLRITSKQEN